jgi:predicted nucleotidyltransferase
VTDFEQLVAILSKAKVEFVIVGGLAATAHGSSRLTQDVDAVYARSPENIERLVTALAPVKPYLRGAPAGLPFEWSRETIRRGLNFTLTTTIGDLDLLGEIIGGGGYDDLLEHTVEMQFFGYACKCLDLPWLIRVKRAAGRPRDLEAVAELEALLDER